jgi:hypothetical protein
MQATVQALTQSLTQASRTDAMHQTWAPSSPRSGGPLAVNQAVVLRQHDRNPLNERAAAAVLLPLMVVALLPAVVTVLVVSLVVGGGGIMLVGQRRSIYYGGKMCWRYIF